MDYRNFYQSILCCIAYTLILLISIFHISWSLNSQECFILVVFFDPETLNSHLAVPIIVITLSHQ